MWLSENTTYSRILTQKTGSNRVPALGTYDTMQQPHDFTSLVEL
jgi:hypothetical protein